jgi:hypothetical protein
MCALRHRFPRLKPHGLTRFNGNQSLPPLTPAALPCSGAALRVSLPPGLSAWPCDPLSLRFEGHTSGVALRPLTACLHRNTAACPPKAERDAQVSLPLLARHAIPFGDGGQARHGSATSASLLIIGATAPESLRADHDSCLASGRQESRQPYAYADPAPCAGKPVHTSHNSCGPAAHSARVLVMSPFGACSFRHRLPRLKEPASLRGCREQAVSPLSSIPCHLPVSRLSLAPSPGLPASV